jgi:hypothetical protein
VCGSSSDDDSDAEDEEDGEEDSNYVLHVKICEAKNLCKKDFFSGSSDPFAEVYVANLAFDGETINDDELRDDKKKKIAKTDKQTTKCINKSLTPQWNETFSFEFEDLEKGFKERPLWIVVKDKDTFSSEFMGMIGPLRLQDLHLGKESTKWYPLRSRSGKSSKLKNGLGEIKVQLSVSTALAPVTLQFYAAAQVLNRPVVVYSAQHDTNLHGTGFFGLVGYFFLAGQLLESPLKKKKGVPMLKRASYASTRCCSGGIVTNTSTCFRWLKNYPSQN